MSTDQNLKNELEEIVDELEKIAAGLSVSTDDEVHKAEHLTQELLAKFSNKHKFFKRLA